MINYMEIGLLYLLHTLCGFLRCDTWGEKDLRRIVTTTNRTRRVHNIIVRYMAGTYVH